MIIPEVSSTTPPSDTETLSILFIGDIFGKSGRRAVKRHLETIKEAYPLDMIIANAENSAGGIGITPSISEELFKAGIHVITTGNHLWKYKEIVGYIQENNRLLRPINYPPGAPGEGFVIYNTPSQARVAILNLIGRVFMEPLDCPFQAADRLLEKIQLGRNVDAIFVDFHAEASSEKGAMGHYLDGRVSAVLGTHTHIPTADHRILPGGTAFQTDVGMTGCYHSIIGMKTETVLPKFLSQLPTHFEQMPEEGTFCGVVVKVTKSQGLCQEIIPIRVGTGLSNAGLEPQTPG